MKKSVRIAAFFLMLMLFCPAAFAATATPTPPPVAIESTLVEPPAEIQRMLDIAYAEWEALNGEKLPDVNKFTEWRGKGYKFEWCAGYITWCMMQSGIPMDELADIKKAAGSDSLLAVDGVYHCKEASPGKLLRAYQIMERATMIPQKGFIVIYGCSFNKVIHAGIVYDVEDLGGGKYRLTTLEGNIKDSIRMYIRDYDMNAEINTNRLKSTNLSEVPEEERILPASANLEYTLMDGKPSSGTSGRYMYYVNRFLMPWVPGDPTLSTPEPTATPEPTPSATPAPTAEPTAEPTPAPTAEPTATPTVPPTEAPIIGGAVELTAVPPVTAAPEATVAPTAEPTAAPTPVPTAEPTAIPTAAPTATPIPEEDEDEFEDLFPCFGQDGNCPYFTRDLEDFFCRWCDRNDNGIEDTEE
ncbi:MAG: hypothetical protein ACI4WX_13560 [Aristaeellaceae bacterium]